MKVNSPMNEVSYTQLNKTKQQDGAKLEKESNKALSVQVEANSVNREGKSQSTQVSPQTKDKVDMSSSEMKVRTDGVEKNLLQDKVTAEQSTQSAISTLQGHGKSLIELGSKHQEAKPDEKKAIESNAKDIMNEMKSIINETTDSGKTTAVKLPKDLDKADIAEALKPENIEKNILKPLEITKGKVDSTIQNMVSSITATQSVAMTRTEVQSTVQKVKESIKDTDVNRISSTLSGRRGNVSHLLK